jgi:hypothetical protein
MGAQYLWRPREDSPWGRIEDLPDPAPDAGVYRLEYYGPDPDTGIAVFRFLGAESPPPWRRPGIRYLSDTEIRKIRALRAQRTKAGRRRHTLQSLADQFGTTPTTIGRLTRPEDHVPVPRKRRADQETRS